MNLDRLNKAHSRLQVYRALLSDIDDAVRSDDIEQALKVRRRRYQQYVAMYEKKYSEALKALNGG